jgi:hypothetical protein
LPKLMKLSGHIVKRWWSEHDLPDVVNHLRMEPEMVLLSASCDALTFCDYIFLTYVCWVIDADEGNRRG